MVQAGVIETTLAIADAQRAAETLRRLTRAGLWAAAVTGGIVIAWHLGAATGQPAVRVLNDLNLVVPEASAIAPGLSAEVLAAHVRPDARPGSLPVVDPATGLRADILGAFGSQLARSRPVPFFKSDVPVVSAGDLVARLTVLLLDLGLGERVPGRNARDFFALQGCIDEAKASSAWADHRRQRQPVSFAEARHAALGLRGHLLEKAQVRHFHVLHEMSTDCRTGVGFE